MTHKKPKKGTRKHKTNLKLALSGSPPPRLRFLPDSPLLPGVLFCLLFLFCPVILFCPVFFCPVIFAQVFCPWVCVLPGDFCPVYFCPVFFARLFLPPVFFARFAFCLVPQIKKKKEDCLPGNGADFCQKIFARSIPRCFLGGKDLGAFCSM